MLQLSNNKISTARGCWKKYYWRYEEGLKPISRPSYVTLGKLIHEAFDMFYKGESDESCLKYIVKSFDEEISKCEMFDQENLVIAKYTGIGMWTYYPHKHLEDFEKIESEAEFEVKVPGTRGITYRGYIDGKITRQGNLFIRECKTTGLNQRQFEGRAKTSGQATGYVWAMRQLGLDPKGVMFDVIRKPLLRKNQKEDMDGFGMRIIDDYKNRRDHYYTRIWSYRNEEELRLFQRDIVEFAREMRAVRRKGHYYRNQDQCWNFNAECPYLKICFQEQPDKLVLDLLYEKGESHGQGNQSNSNGGQTASERPAQEGAGTPEGQSNVGCDQRTDEGGGQVSQ